MGPLRNTSHPAQGRIRTGPVRHGKTEAGCASTPLGDEHYFPYTLTDISFSFQGLLDPRSVFPQQSPIKETFSVSIRTWNWVVVHGRFNQTNLLRPSPKFQKNLYSRYIVETLILSRLCDLFKYTYGNYLRQRKFYKKKKFNLIRAENQARNLRRIFAYAYAKYNRSRKNILFLE